VGEDEDVITLLDEEGTEHEFSIVDVLEVSEQRYAILQPLDAGEEPDTAVIFRMEGDALVTIEDDAEFERVRQAFEAESSAAPDPDGAVADATSTDAAPADGTSTEPSEGRDTTSH